MMNHRSVKNGTPLDRRHTNIALEVRKGGYDPTLFGYTDSCPDPRWLDPGDPALTTYEGVLPDLFREGQGVIAEGMLTPDGVFAADSVLAKHDEKYMPPEVAKALKDKGVWRGADAASNKTQ